MITHVAIIFNGVRYSLPAPNRHHNVISLIHELTGRSLGKSWQGFLTDTGKFVGREEACKIARACNQIKVKTSPRYVLFSEDVW